MFKSPILKKGLLALALFVSSLLTVNCGNPSSSTNTNYVATEDMASDAGYAPGVFLFSFWTKPGFAISTTFGGVDSLPNSLYNVVFSYPGTSQPNENLKVVVPPNPANDLIVSTQGTAYRMYRDNFLYGACVWTLIAPTTGLAVNTDLELPVRMTLFFSSSSIGSGTVELDPVIYVNSRLSHPSKFSGADSMLWADVFISQIPGDSTRPFAGRVRVAPLTGGSN